MTTQRNASDFASASGSSSASTSTGANEASRSSCMTAQRNAGDFISAPGSSASASTWPNEASRSSDQHPPGPPSAMGVAIEEPMDIDSEDPAIALADELVAEIDDRVLSIQVIRSLEFFIPPSNPPPSTPLDGLSIPNSGRLSLDLRKPCNGWFIDTEARFVEIISQMRQKGNGRPEWHRVEDAASTALTTIYSVKLKHYEGQLSLANNTKTVDNRCYFRSLVHTNRQVASTTLAALIMYIRFHHTTRDMRVTLALLQSILRMTNASPFAEQIPKDIHTIVNYYGLHSHFLTFISCPQCFSLYDIDKDDSTRNGDLFAKGHQMDRCSSKFKPDGPECGADLWRA
ncbi:hypothetical protein BT96DRAFT_1010351 [Gymnopus androsaceus JB14]|uniref:Uncharacterized protein n=1 Tax=Gymnopus androsaceus JB14 TaxID=1447944 RepID=A0A6A4GAV5_9AGAR|nr:hypothetical protein BT96DRAFT_1010351 [Gymnopus androsaceus JB14]